MILKSITLENFRSHRYTQLSFNKGITTIIGPNGSGKSSIFEAMSFALYGISDYTIEELIRKGTGRFKVELTFELGGNIYRVVRSRGRRSSGDSVNKLYINGRLYAEGSKEVNKRIKEILGINHDVFLNAIYIKQGEIDNLINIRPAERKKIIGEILGIGRYEKVWREMGDVISRFKNKLENIKGQLSRKEVVEKEIEDVKKEIENMERELNRLKEDCKKIEGEYQNKKKILEEYNEKERKYNELKSKIDNIDNCIKRFENEKENLERDLESIRDRMDILKDTEMNYKRYCKIEEELKNEVLAEMDRYEKYYQRYKGLDEVRNKLEKNIEDINRKMKEEGVGDIQLEDVEKKIDVIKRRLKELEEIWEKLSELENLNSRLEEINGYIEELNRCKEGYLEYEKIDKKLGELETKILKLEKLKVEKKNIKSAIKKLKDEISKLKEELKPLKEIEEKIKKEDELENKLKEYKEKFQKLNSEITERKTKIKELEEIIEKLSKAGNKCPLCQSDIDDSKKESLLSKYREDLEKMENELEKLYEEQEMCRKEIFRLERLLKDISSLKNEYGGLKEKERNLQNKLQELDKYSKELQHVNNEIKKYIDAEKEKEELKKKKESLEEMYRRYQTSEDYLKGVNREELLKRKKELSEVVRDYNKERINEEREYLSGELDRWTDIKMWIVDKREKEKELNNVLNEMKNIKKYFDHYMNLKEKKDSLEKDREKYRRDYERYEKARAVLEDYSKKYNVDIFNLIDTLEKSIRVVEETLKTCMSKREEYRREIESLKYDSEDHNRIKKEVEEIRNNLTSMVREIGEYNGRLKSRRRDLKNRLEELDKLKELEKEKEKLERFIKYLENIREKVFSKDGFQQYLRKRYTPLIQRYTNEIFSEFELPYHYIQIKEDYDILVDEFPVKNLSGGEQIAVSLALRLGIAKALCSSLQFIILDEPTAFLDEDRRKKLLDIFKSIKTISQIFIISHHQELEQIADSTIHVTKRGGISYVSQGIT